MPKICYVDRRFSAGSTAIIEQANQIINAYMAKGFKLSLRQLYYQFVSRDLIANKQSEYKRLGSVINDARLAGLIDWEAIEDRGRNLASVSFWENPAAIIDTCARQYRIDLWANQKNRPEVWVEKDALSGVVGTVCKKLRVGFMACKGYMSQSEMWDAGAVRLATYIQNGQQPIILHLGDHDPSGIDMTRDITDRMSLFLGEPLHIKRLALNMDQIQQYNPPPNPAKTTDARFQDYEEKYGDESWELDALKPEVLSDLIESNIVDLIDQKKWNVAKDTETEERQSLELVSKHYSAVAQFVQEQE